MLAERIVETPAAEGRDGKIRVIDLDELECWDDLGLIETILRLDLERVAAGAEGPISAHEARPRRAFSVEVGGLLSWFFRMAICRFPTG